MSVSQDDKELDWGGNLPAIPSSTGVFWPSIAVGVICALFGFYLILTPVPDVTKGVDSSTTPSPLSSASPEGPVDPGEVRVLRCGFVDSKDSTFALGLEEFAKGVFQRTDGELVIELLPGGLIDGRKLAERELVEAVRKGQLAMALSTTSPLSNFNHDLDIFDLPLLFDGPEHVDAVLDGDVGDQLLDSLQEHNLKGTGLFRSRISYFQFEYPTA